MSFESFRLRFPDGTEYGPITMTELSQWVRENRVPKQALMVDIMTGETRPVFNEVIASVPPTPVITPAIVTPASPYYRPTDVRSDQVRAAECWQVRNTMRVTSVASFIWAAINIGMGSMNINDGNSSGTVQIFLGLLLLADGLVFVTTMSPVAMIFDGLVFLIIALWNIGISLLSFSNSEPQVMWLVVGGFQVYWGIMSFIRYGKFKAALALEPPQPVMQEMAQRIKYIRSASPKRAGDIVTFTTKTASKHYIWKGQLGPEYAVLLANNGEVIQVLRRDELLITPEKKVLIGKDIKAGFEVGAMKINGTIHPDYLDRYFAWRGAMAGIGALGVPAQ